MAKDVGDIVRDSLSQVVRDAAQNFGNGSKAKSSNGALSGMRGVAAGAGLAALAPLAAKGAGRAVKSRLATGAAKGAVKKPGRALSDATSKLGDSVGKGVGEKVKEKVDESGGVAGIAKEAGKGMLPIGGGDGGGGGGGGVPGVGKGRRMPVQQSCDVAVPLETAYNQWTQYEEWPNFMHRVTRVTQEDECTVSFATKIWGVTKEFQADIDTQRPDERVKWRVSQGITHTGVVTFHELAPRLTRIELTVDVDPGSLLEKYARGARYIKRAMRADLHRFKAFIEMQEVETGAWRGVIEEGELVEEHPEDYDEEREYSDVEDARPDEESDEDQEQGEEDEEAEAEPERPARASSSGRSRSRSSGGSGNGRSAGSRPKSRSGSSRSSSGNRSGGQRKKASSRS
jgi:Polyketide cyclase / dehydrase and lipid transport